jgi:phosphoenolpyruvate phosphomutase
VGLGVSTTQLGVPDLNLMTFSEALEAAVRIDRATELPVIADCDNGYGGMLNVLRTAREYELAGIAGICLEDNVFPKRNSLLGSDVDRELLPKAEHARRIAAIKGRQDGPDFHRHRQGRGPHRGPRRRRGDRSGARLCRRRSGRDRHPLPRQDAR